MDTASYLEFQARQLFRLTLKHLGRLEHRVFQLVQLFRGVLLSPALWKFNLFRSILQ